MLFRRPGHITNGFRMDDLDNPIKPLLDWLLRVELIENDKYCDRILAQWGDAPLGVRLRPFVKTKRGTE
jgi:hypothetical protein